MAPNRGIASHFAASKASISRATRSIKAKPGKDVATPAAQKDSQSSTATAASSSDDVFTSVATSLKPLSPKKSTPRRQTRTRLRTPDEGEVDRILAENERLLQSSPSTPLASSSSLAEPPVSLLGTPPTTPRASRSSPLLEPTQISPISVRTDPDTNKMYLLLNRSPSKPAATAPSSSSPSKRKMTTPPKSTSPSKTPRTLDRTPRRLITGEAEMLGTEEEDGLVLTPGRAKGTRVVLGSPSKSPLLGRSGDTPKEQALRRIVDEDEEGYITPRSVRQRPKGLPLPPMATQRAAAVFRGATLPASSSAPSLGSLKQEPTAVETSYIDLDTDSTPLTEEDELTLPQAKHTLSTDLPLPSFYSSLLTLHMALEHALVVHLATAGCASATLESTTASDDQHKIVRLPNLISYTALRPLVERSGGRRLGPTELRRLASVWLDFQRCSSPEVEEEVRGLGFIISKTRSMDARTGRRALDWGIGIELEIKRTVREKTPPTEVNFGGVSVQASPVLPKEGFDESVKGTPKMPVVRDTTPPPSSSADSRALRSPFAASSSPLLSSPRRRTRAASPTSSPSTRTAGAAKARESMSVVAMWNNGLETRKAEVGRRLRERCARFHQLWLDERGISVPPVSSEPGTPSRKAQQSQNVGLGIATSADSDAEDDASSSALPREAIMGAGGLFTPSATRSGGHRAGKRMFHMDPSELDGALTSEDEDEDGDLSGTTLRAGAQGKQLLMDEVSTTVMRNSKSMPQLRSSLATPGKVQVEGEVPREGSELRSWHVDFPLNDPRVVKPIPLATLPSLSATLATPHRNKDKPLLGVADPSTPQKPTKFIAAPPLPPATPSTAGMTLRERIAAKEQLRRTASLPSLSDPASSSGMTPMQALSQRSLVSRLPELCSILFMLFSNGTSLSSNGITRSPTIPMQDLLTKLGKSVKIQLSTRECRQSLDVLGRIAPGFLVVIQPSEGVGAGAKEYVRLGNNADTGRLWRLNEVRAKIAAELNGK